MASQCLKIGLTGGIGSGKTAVSDLFAAMGVPVIDADVISRSLLEPGTEATQRVISEFGQGIAATTNTIDRKKLREYVFDHSDARNKLEAILHPLVYERIKLETAAIKAPYCIIVIPLLFEAGHQDLVDRILVVDADRRTQVERVKSRDRTSEEEIQKILDSQIDAAERRAMADDVVENNGDIDSLKSEVNALDTRYRKLAGASAV